MKRKIVQKGSPRKAVSNLTADYHDNDNLRTMEIGLLISLALKMTFLICHLVQNWHIRAAFKSLATLANDPLYDIMIPTESGNPICPNMRSSQYSEILDIIWPENSMLTYFKCLMPLIACLGIALKMAKLQMLAIFSYGAGFVLNTIQKTFGMQNIDIEERAKYYSNYYALYFDNDQNIPLTRLISRIVPHFNSPMGQLEQVYLSEGLAWETAEHFQLSGNKQVGTIEVFHHLETFLLLLSLAYIFKQNFTGGSFIISLKSGGLNVLLIVFKIVKYVLINSSYYSIMSFYISMMCILNILKSCFLAIIFLTRSMCLSLMIALKWTMLKVIRACITILTGVHDMARITCLPNNTQAQSKVPEIVPEMDSKEQFLEACRKGIKTTVKHMPKNDPNFDINVRCTETGDNALQIAMKNNQYSVVQILMDCFKTWIDFNSMNFEGKTALEVAIELKYLTFARNILHHKKFKLTGPVCGRLICAAVKADELKFVQMIFEKMTKVGLKFNNLMITSCVKLIEDNKRVLKNPHLPEHMRQKTKGSIANFKGVIFQLLELKDVIVSINQKTSSENTTEDYDCLLRDIECFICLEEMKERKIVRCSNDHWMCQECSKNLDRCPCCRDIFENNSPQRCYTGEKLISVILKLKNKLSD